MMCINVWLFWISLSLPAISVLGFISFLNMSSILYNMVYGREFQYSV